MKVGILRGSFNPPHHGHYLMMYFVLEKKIVDKILVIPSYNPLKDKSDYVSDTHRLNMLELSIGNLNKYFRGKVSINTHDLDKGGPSYMIDTLENLFHNNPEDEYSVIIGADSFYNLQKWKDWELLLELYNFIIYPRIGYEFAYIPPYLYNYIQENPKIKNKLTFLEGCKFLDISSSKIREVIKDGSLFKKGGSSEYIARDIFSYIKKNKLYV